MRIPTRLLSTLLLTMALSAPTFADEGLWLFNDFPSQRVAAEVGFAPSAADLEHLQRSAVRIGAGGSGSFVSAEGLVLTNHHVAADCIQKLSSAERNLMAKGFVAARREDELACPDLEITQLVEIRRVTERVHAAATKAASPAEAARARRAEIAAIEKECGPSAEQRCQVVELFGGGHYDLYRSRRYSDVRLAFAPEAVLAQFGGDPDNFDFPRFCLDFTLFRVYEQGRPAKIEHFLRWSPTGIGDGEPSFIAGHPGQTKRLATVAELEFLRDHQYPAILANRDLARELLERYGERGPEQRRLANDEMRRVTNALKATGGFQAGLLDPTLMAGKRDAERELAGRLAKEPALAAKYGDPFAEIARAYEVYRTFEPRFRLLDAELPQVGRLTGTARTLVRLAREDAKPDGERIAEFRAAGRASLELRLFSKAPIYPDLEQYLLTAYLWRLRSQLGVVHPLVRQTMGRDTPEEVAARLIRETQLGDIERRRELAQGGQAAHEASQDPLLAFVAALEEESYSLRRRFDEEVEGVLTNAYTRLAQLRFELGGKDSYPDATGSLRLSVGRVKGYQEDGRDISWRTTWAEMFARSATKGGREPWALSSSLEAARGKLELASPVVFVSTHDTHGGNSGSPTVDREMRVVGVLFDGNLYSLARRFAYSDEQARSLSVDSRAMLQALRVIYPASHLAEELVAAR